MSFKNNFKFYFLIIITFGLIIIFAKKEDEEKIYLDIEKLIKNLGTKNNIKKIENSQNKIIITFEKKEKIEIDKIKKCKEISGIFITSKTITLIVGKSSLNIKKEIDSLIKK